MTTGTQILSHEGGERLGKAGDGQEGKALQLGICTAAGHGCFAEAVALALPEHKKEIQADSIRNAERRSELVSGLEALGIHVYPSQSACALADFCRPVDAIAEALKERKILVRSCMSFDDINDGCHLRLAVKDEVSNQKLIETLREVLLCAEKA